MVCSTYLSFQLFRQDILSVTSTIPRQGPAGPILEPGLHKWEISPWASSSAVWISFYFSICEGRRQWPTESRLTGISCCRHPWHIHQKTRIQILCSHFFKNHNLDPLLLSTIFYALFISKTNGHPDSPYHLAWKRYTLDCLILRVDPGHGWQITLVFPAFAFMP